MMKKTEHYLKLWRWHIYISPVRLYVIPCSRSNRGVGIARRMKTLHNRRYKSTDGCCELCGKHFEYDQMQMHHILPLAEFPRFGRKHWNVLMLCRHCHYMIHKNPVVNMEQMQRVASKHGVDMNREFAIYANRRYNDSIERLKGGEK